MNNPSQSNEFPPCLVGSALNSLTKVAESHHQFKVPGITLHHRWHQATKNLWRKKYFLLRFKYKQQTVVFADDYVVGAATALMA